jgi:hypothetical protein
MQSSRRFDAVGELQANIRYWRAFPRLLVKMKKLPEFGRRCDKSAEMARFPQSLDFPVGAPAVLRADRPPQAAHLQAAHLQAAHLQAAHLMELSVAR